MVSDMIKPSYFNEFVQLEAGDKLVCEYRFGLGDFLTHLIGPLTEFGASPLQ